MTGTWNAVYREYREIKTRRFWATVPGNRAFTLRDATRQAQLERWLDAHPQPGYPFTCEHCKLGTGCANRSCLACTFC